MPQADLYCQEPAHPAQPVLCGQVAGTGAAQAHDVGPLDTVGSGEAQGC